MVNKELIDQELEVFLSNFDYHGLYKPARYLLSLGGKRIRPIILLQAVEVFGGKKEEAIPLALAVEIFHNFTLMHDDIMDNSKLRRGNLTVHEKWNVNNAVLTGDAMMIQSYQLIEKIPEKFQPAIYKAFNKMALWLCEGQQDDMDFETREEVSLEEYMEMIKNKTSVLIGFCFQAGAIFGKASKETQQTIYDFGINLGLAFQLQDDYLDLYPRSNKMGKTIGGDLLNQKKSLPYLIAIENADAEKREEINTLIQSQNEDRVEHLIEIFDSLDVKKECESNIEELFQKASNNLLSITDYDVSSIKEFAAQLMQREF